MINTLEEAIPEIETKHYNCLIRNGITQYEDLADMTDYDLANLKGVHRLETLILLRDKARKYRDLQEKNVKK